MVGADKAGNISEIKHEFIISPGVIKDKENRNFPNPFSEKTNILFQLDENDYQKISEIRIYDLFGNLVVSLPIKNKLIGWNLVEWDGKNGSGNDVANGGYICVIKKDLYIKIAVLR